MTSRPLIRWKSLWFGILVLVFLGWGWVRSASLMERFSFCSPMGGVAAANELGRVSIFGNPPEAGTPRVFYERETSYPDLLIPMTSIFWEWQEGWLSVSYKFLILLFLDPWISLLAGRWQRQRKANKSP